LVGPDEVRVSLAAIGGLVEILDRPSEGDREIPVEIEGPPEQIARTVLRFR
jgi:hypothetical protein